MYEAARSAHYLFAKRPGLTDILVQEMGELVDFVHPRLNNSSVLQLISGVGQSLVQTIYDGMEDSDIDTLLLELAKCCVTWLLNGLTGSGNFKNKSTI